MGLHHRRRLADPARRPHRPRHRAARAPLRPGVGRLPQRDVRQRRRADHRASSRCARATSSSSRPRSPAASSATCCSCSGCRSSSAGSGGASQKFHRTAATNTAAMLFLGVVALVMPAVFDLSLYGTLDARAAGDRSPELLAAPIVLIAAYAGSLIYAFTAQTRSVPVRTHEGEHDEPMLPTRGRRGRARRRHGADDGAGGDAGRRAGAGAGALRLHRAVRRRHRHRDRSATPPSTTPR